MATSNSITDEMLDCLSEAFSRVPNNPEMLPSSTKEMQDNVKQASKNEKREKERLKRGRSLDDNNRKKKSS